MGVFSHLEQTWMVPVPRVPLISAAGNVSFTLFTCRQENRAFGVGNHIPEPELWLVVESEHGGDPVEFDLSKRTEPLAVLVREAIEKGPS